MHTLRGGEGDAAHDAVEAVERAVVGAGEVESHLVVVAFLHIVECLAAHGVGLLVGKVELIPVDLTSGGRTRERVVERHPRGVVVSRHTMRSIPDVVGRAGEFLVVIRTGVGGVAIPAERRGAVVAVLERSAGDEAAVVVDVEVPCGDGRRLEGGDDAGVTLHAVLVAPVGVVVVRAGKSEGLLGGCALLGALGGSAPRGEGEAVAVAKLLLRGEEVAEGVVERALDDTLVGPAVGGAHGEGPAARHQSRAVGEYGAGKVVAVAEADGGL